ncbi:MAG TPA: hypothetical protein VGC45_11255 [Gryllotalpicola sp.]
MTLFDGTAAADRETAHGIARLTRRIVVAGVIVTIAGLVWNWLRW